ncbi:glycosyl hydrolase [Thalassobellus suaedae]|uniref:Glycosyl hydrolase n=1 Tax=Thalassobellus suaedae TaxID=3074124 RepID=A0ABY9XUF5_9FLAO|nr:glycosyl hydrolase [Flavobacteriaceae bacterium HL-DH14]
MSKEFWDMVYWALTEADRLGLKIAFHAADGFAVAGGPWITPEMSMQKVVWYDTIVSENETHHLKLPIPNHYQDYYKDIATFALPVKEVFKTSINIQPKITSTLPDFDASFLTDNSTEKTQLRLYEKGWIQYEFEKPFNCKSIQIETKGNNYQAHRLGIEVSNDGENFKSLGRLEAPRHGWQDTDVFYTHSIEPTKAKYFRFVYNPEGTEPGAEDLDAAKWKQALKVTKIILSNEALIDNYQGKSGAVWRISPQSTNAQIKNQDCIDKSKMINISEFVNADGVLNWKASKGNWRILRMGHTSTGHENATGGAGKGLEVDKFNPEAIRFQLDHWFGKMLRIAGPELASRVVEILHLDSWECGSQNWSPVFRDEFKKRRGYDLVDYLPVMAGIPVESVETSEQVLYDIRKTISELITDNFFGTLAEEAEKSGVKFSSENVAPTMVSDNLLHFKTVDYPGGEFWLKSPTHDKPNDMLDAISGGHIYNKDIIQAEAFTELRMDWDEHPGNLKTLADRNYALGINRFFYHVFVHNPWVDRKPGMTLDGIGTFFQRDQTWWEPGKAFFDYCQRVQFQLQKGKPVVDLAVFTGEEIPSRSVLPDRLVPLMPNVFGDERVASEIIRLKNDEQPTAKMPKEVTYSKNTTDLSQWVNALNGYKYDSFNTDVLLNNATVKDGKVIFSNGIAYGALFFPGKTKMNPNNNMSLDVADKILDLVKAGATVFLGEKPNDIPGMYSNEDKVKWQKVIDEIWSLNEKKLPYLGSDFSEIGINQDVKFLNLNRNQVGNIAWTHREAANESIYFLSNQKSETQNLDVSFRVEGKLPILFNPVTNTYKDLSIWKIDNGRTVIPLRLEANASYFVIFKEATSEKASEGVQNWSDFEIIETLNEDWELQFDVDFNGPSKPIQVNKLFDWSMSENDSIKYYSGTVSYTKIFDWKADTTKDLWLQMDEVNNLASIQLNGKACGVVWTYPFRINISDAIRKGDNILEIKVTNTWANRLIGDQKLPEKQRLTWTTAPFRLTDEPLLKAGLLGAVTIIKENN